MIIAEGCEYSLDCQSTKLNNNVIVVGGSGAGKTTSVVEPNILKAQGSYVITDPKGNLYNRLSPYLKRKGYKILNLDLATPNDDTRYNFFDYINDEHDVIKIAHILMSAGGNNVFSERNSYFYYNGELILASAIAALKEYEEYLPDKKLDSVLNYCNSTLFGENSGHDSDDGENASKWEKLSTRLLSTLNNLPAETAGSILSTIGSVIGKLNTNGVEEMMTSNKKKLDIESIGKRKTALFVRVSDTDRSMDPLVTIFFTQVINVLCNYADKECKDNALPVPVRFIMDDFATNCVIEDIPRMISSIRSRNISVMILLQAEAQLEERYNNDSHTIISNCDTYLYLGGNDINTAKNVAERADVPFKKILNMPTGKCWVFRRGQEPIYTQISDVEKLRQIFEFESMVYEYNALNC